MNVFNWLRKLLCEDILLENIKLKDLLAAQEKANSKEDYYNTKYPKVDLTYLRHETDGDYQVDLRNFFNLHDTTIPTVSGDTDDDKALNALKYVIKNITYVADDSKETYKSSEYWAYAYQTLKKKKGDCEDGAILLANIMVKSGIPYWKVRLSAGDVKGGGHCYVTYYCESQDMWVVLDWCYWPNELAIADRADYKNEANYYNVWFSWNRDYCFSAGTKLTANDYIKAKHKKH